MCLEVAYFLPRAGPGFDEDFVRWFAGLHPSHALAAEYLQVRHLPTAHMSARIPSIWQSHRCKALAGALIHCITVFVHPESAALLLSSQHAMFSEARCKKRRESCPFAGNTEPGKTTTSVTCQPAVRRESPVVHAGGWETWCWCIGG